MSVAQAKEEFIRRLCDLLCELKKLNHVNTFLEIPQWCDMEWVGQVNAVRPRRITLRGVRCVGGGKVPCDYVDGDYEQHGEARRPEVLR